MSNDWKKDLEKKATQLNLNEGGESNVRSINSDISSGIHRIHRIQNTTEKRNSINNVREKGGNRMITVEGALKDLETIEQEANDTGAKAVVKALKVVVKFLSTMRTNQLLTDAEKLAIAKARKERQAKEEKK